MTRGGRASWILAIIAHVLAWVVYLPVTVGCRLAIFAGRARGGFQSVGNGIFARSLDRSRLAHGANQPKQRGYFLTGSQDPGCSSLVGPNGGIGHLFRQPGSPAGRSEVDHWGCYRGDSPWPVLTVGKIGRVVALWVAAFLMLGFCVLAGFSVGSLFLPAAFALLSLAAVFGLSRTTAPD